MATDIQEKAIKVLIAMNAAITNMHLYPPTSDIVGNAVDKVNNELDAIFEHEDTLALF